MEQKIKRLQFGVNWTDVSTREPSSNDVVAWRDVEELIRERNHLRDMVVRLVIANNLLESEETDASEYERLIKNYNAALTDMKIYHDNYRYGFPDEDL